MWRPSAAARGASPVLSGDVARKSVAIDDEPMLKTCGISTLSVDFYSSGSRQGQALMLQNFAASHNVRMVAVSIGGNDFNFASIVQSCVTDFLTSPSWLPNYCDDDSSVTANFTSAHVAVRSAVAQALTVASAAERRPVHDERASRNSSGRGTWRR